MKLLIITSHIYDDLHGLNQIKNGLAIMISSLCRNFSNQIDVEVYTSGCRTSSINLGYTRILSSRCIDILKYLIKYRTWMELAERKKLRNLYSRLVAENCFSYIKKNVYDLTNIHDLSRTNVKILQLCIENRIPCVLTLHIYIGRQSNQKLDGYAELCGYENYVISNTKLPIIVVSSGMKKRILNDYFNEGIKDERVIVIPDGTDIKSTHYCHKTPQEQNFISNDKKIFLCIGTINERKNQIQLLEAITYLKPEIRKTLKVLFIGKDNMDGKLQETIKTLQLNDIAEYVGEVNNVSMMEFYSNAFAVISTSINEAFGLTFIEGFCYGIPSVFFYNVDSVKELYFKDAVTLIKGLKCLDIAAAIEETCTKNWDADAIKEHSKKFIMKETAQQYEKAYGCLKGEIG